MRGIFLLGSVFAVSCFAAGPVTLVDFAKEGHGWRGNPRTRDARQSNGFTVELTGEEDPWLEGPEVAIPGRGDAQKLVLTLEAECGEDGAFQLFFAPPGQHFTADASIFMTQSEASPDVYKGVLPLASDRLRFRLDPPGAKGRVTLRTLRALPLTPRAAPAFVKPADVALPDLAWRVESGPVRVAHDPVKWNAFACFVGGQKMAQSNPAETLAYVDGNQVKTVVPAAAEVSAEQVPDGVLVRAKTRDPDGAAWHLSRRIVSDRGGVRIETSVSVDTARDVIHLPWLTLFAGVGTFGESKRQALLPGVEYLDCEPSSNEKEIRGTASNRRMVDAFKVCYPMMALAASGQ